jgi:hypothetical protein
MTNTTVCDFTSATDVALGGRSRAGHNWYSIQLNLKMAIQMFVIYINSLNFKYY